MEQPVKPLTAAAFALSVFVSTSYAADVANAQWKHADQSMFDLVQDGYNVVAISHHAAEKNAKGHAGAAFTGYILQKGHEVYRCLETTWIEGQNKEGRLACQHLVKPYHE
jgi:hypothetical protein